MCEESVSPFEIQCEKYSSIMKLIRVTAYVLQFIQRIRLCVSKRRLEKSESKMGYLTSDKLNEAEIMWLLHIQRKHFNDVYKAIKMQRNNNLQRQLGLFIDDDGILRCKGRLGNAELTEGARHPILLPRNDRITYLIIDHSHKQILHSGTSQTLSQVRQKYWILQGRATVKSVLRNCITCRKHEGGPYQTPVMPALPKTRVTKACPFSRTGLDYMGPIYIKTNEGTIKTWVCLFTCLVTRAIHLEMMKNMTAEDFLYGCRRFITVQGTLIEIWSDNASQFKTASDVLHSLWKRTIKCDQIQSYVSNSGIKWSFIVELAPWMGGFYERLVGLVKQSLRKSVGRNLLSDTQLQTLLKEIEAVVNSRHLVYAGDDIDSSITLTPGHLLTLNPKTGFPELIFEQQDPNFDPYESSPDRLIRIWKKGQRFLNGFWKLWRDDYLLSLRERTQNTLKTGRVVSHSYPQNGDIVLVKDDLPRGCWNMGKIVKLILSADSCVRSGRVKLHTGRIIGRPLKLLFPLEVSVSGEQTRYDEHNTSVENTKQDRRPIRKAAIQA